MSDSTFITKRITNMDIYKTLKSVEAQVLKTNGTVIWHTSALWALFLLICGIIGALGVV